MDNEHALYLQVCARRRMLGRPPPWAGATAAQLRSELNGGIHAPYAPPIGPVLTPVSRPVSRTPLRTRGETS